MRRFLARFRISESFLKDYVPMSMAKTEAEKTAIRYNSFATVWNGFEERKELYIV